MFRNMWFFNKMIQKFSCALRGMRYALRTDTSVQLIVLTGGALVFVAYLMWPFSTEALFFLVLAWTILLITELQNSAHEKALDRLHPEQNEHIGRSKDIAAASVLAALFFILVVVVSIFLHIL